MEGAIRQTVAATHRSMKDIVNGLARDVAMTAIARTKRASDADIRALESKPWWPRYIAKRLRSGGVTANYRVRVPKGKQVAKFVNGVWTDGKTRGDRRLLQMSGAKGDDIWSKNKLRLAPTSAAYRKMMFQNGKSARKYYQAQGAWTQAIARKASQVIIRARLRSVNFLRAGFIPAARAFAQATGRTVKGGGGVHDRNSVGVAKGSFKVATELKSPVAEIINSAVGLKSKTPARGLAVYAAAGLKQAMEEVPRRQIAWATARLQREFNKTSAKVIHTLMG